MCKTEQSVRERENISNAKKDKMSMVITQNSNEPSSPKSPVFRFNKLPFDLFTEVKSSIVTEKDDILPKSSAMKLLKDVS